MKNLVAVTALLAAGFLLGVATTRRRASAKPAAEQLLIEVKADTSEAVAALKELQAQVVKTEAVVANFTFRGADLVACARRHSFRETATA